MVKLADNWTLEQIVCFDDILDVRSPAEYALDHLPGSLNFPVLDDAERSRVGLLYKKVSRFEAKRQGASLVATHIAAHLEKRLADKAEEWQPLVYCWRGGMRSAAMVRVLNDIGWPAQQLPGGYKAYRRRVIAKISELVPKLRFVVLCGPTGVGKTRLLDTLQARSKQVLNLERLANHKGSVLGEAIVGGQPSQKRFESELCGVLRTLDTRRTVYIEAESSKIGHLQIPMALLAAMYRGFCVSIELRMPLRVSFLLSEYRHLLHNAELFERAIERLETYVGKKKTNYWLSLYQSGRMAGLAENLLMSHYDPLYARSIEKHFGPSCKAAATVRLGGLDEQHWSAAAEQIEAYQF